MKRLALLLPVVVLGCGSTPEGGKYAPAHSVDLENPPPSALAALVRSLEVVDALRAPDTDIRVRAIECDSMVDRERQTEYVRVVLHVTVLAPRHEQAKRIFDELANALATEAASSARIDSAVHGRIERVFQSMKWSTRDVPEQTFRKLVSISDSIRVEVQTEARTPPDPQAAPVDFEQSQGVSEYIRLAALDERAAIGPVETEVDVYRPRSGTRDLRFHIEPEDRHTPFSREQIGEFLYLLEAGSPATRVTHVTIAPHEPGSDVTANEWTFQAGVSVRTPDR